MPNTRKKIVKTIYKEENNDSEPESIEDFEDSGSEAEIPDHSSSDEEVDSSHSVEEFNIGVKKKKSNMRKSKTSFRFRQNMFDKVNKSNSVDESVINEDTSTSFSVKNLTDADKLLPNFLNLSESDSSEDEPAPSTSKKGYSLPHPVQADSESDDQIKNEYNDVWSNNIQDNSEEVAKRTFLELEEQKRKIEKAKLTLQDYSKRDSAKVESNVTDLLALGEDLSPQQLIQKSPLKKKTKASREDSDSEMEDWEEVKENKPVPQQGLELIVNLPDTVCRKTKKIDVEMMMKRKLNRVKKEYQVYMHKVHVLCWLGHGNYINHIINDAEVMAAALTLMPSKDCYPGERVNLKYFEEITKWFKDKLILKQDKNEDKFRPKAPPLKTILLEQIKKRTVSTKKYMVFIFVSMLRALGLKCRVMLNFVTLPIKPLSSDLCSLSTKDKKDADENSSKTKKRKSKEIDSNCSKSKCKLDKIGQVDGTFDLSLENIKQVDVTFDPTFDNIMQVDGSNDIVSVKTKSTRSKKSNNNEADDGVSPPKKLKTTGIVKSSENNVCPQNNTNLEDNIKTTRTRRLKLSKTVENDTPNNNLLKTKRGNKSTAAKIKSKEKMDDSTLKESVESSKTVIADDDKNTMTSAHFIIGDSTEETPNILPSPRKTRRNIKCKGKNKGNKEPIEESSSAMITPKILVTDENNEKNTIASEYFSSLDSNKKNKKLSLSRNKTKTIQTKQSPEKCSPSKNKLGTFSTADAVDEKSKYFNNSGSKKKSPKNKTSISPKSTRIELDDKKRVSHRDLMKKSKANNDVTADLVGIIKDRIKEAKTEAKGKLVKGKSKKESDEDSDYLPEELNSRRKSVNDDDFKPIKTKPKVKIIRKIDRRVLSSDEEVSNKNKTDVWCEVYVEEIEQWICVDVIKAQVHCANAIYSRATHPVCYVVGWDNNNNLKDLTRRYVPYWNTVTRKQRVDPQWWKTAIQPWCGPPTARDREEDEQLDRMQLEAPLPKTISEYKNHPLYALKRHLLKFEAIYPPDAATVGFIRNEAVYPRSCVYVCRSRDTWLKEAKVVCIGEKPYKVVKARPKWDKLSNKLITDKPLEVFGPWQVKDYEPPVAEYGIVPRNAYGNVELFKQCMLPIGTVHIKLPGLNRIAKKLNIDCAPAMTGFEFNGGWSHPVYDGFVVCKEYEEIITEAWVEDQGELERKEQEKNEHRIYGNWKRLIKGLLITERLKNKYGFEKPSTSQDKKKSKGPRLATKKKN